MDLNTHTHFYGSRVKVLLFNSPWTIASMTADHTALSMARKQRWSADPCMVNGSLSTVRSRHPRHDLSFVVIVSEIQERTRIEDMLKDDQRRTKGFWASVDFFDTRLRGENCKNPTWLLRHALKLNHERRVSVSAAWQKAERAQHHEQMGVAITMKHDQHSIVDSLEKSPWHHDIQWFIRVILLYFMDKWWILSTMRGNVLFPTCWGGSMLQYWAGVDVDIRCHRCSCAASCWRHNEPDKIGVGTDITDNFLDLFSIFWLFQDVSGPENSVPSIPRRSRKVKQFIPQADAFFFTERRSQVTRQVVTPLHAAAMPCLTRSMRACGRWRFHFMFQAMFQAIFHHG